MRGNNLFLFDGVDTTDVTTGGFTQNFNFDAIQEVAISTTGISAEYGRAQGAVVNVVTKSGTNRFAGSAKVFWTNDNWNAQNKGNNAINGAPFARVKNDTTVPDYNYTLGGPIWQDHVWFFGSYETQKQVRTAVQTFVSTVYPDETGQSAVPHVRRSSLGRQADLPAHPLAAFHRSVQQRPDHGIHQRLLGRIGGAPGIDGAGAEPVLRHRLPEAGKLVGSFRLEPNG